MAVALDAQQLDQLFGSIWAGLNDALMAGDKSTAMTYLNAGAKIKYGPVFDVLMPQMPQIIASYSSLGRSDLSPDVAEYAIARPYNGTTHLYFIYFLRDADGVWRLDSM